MFEYPFANAVWGSRMLRTNRVKEGVAMNFRQSAVRSVTREASHEAWDRLPRDIHPAYLGTGELAFGLDATGMMGLNARMTQYRDTMAFEHGPWLDEKHLHITRDEAISDHYAPQAPSRPDTLDGYSIMPFGWLDYVLTVDGTCYDAAALADVATDWTRTFSPVTGILKTSFVVDGLELCWTTGMKEGSVEADFALDACCREGRKRCLSVRVTCHQTLRDGRPLARTGVSTEQRADLVCRRWHASTATATARVLKPIVVSWALAWCDPAHYEQSGQTISVTWTSSGIRHATGFRLVCGSDRDGTDSLAYTTERAIALREDGVSRAFAAIADSWRAYFADAADVEIGSAEKEFLFRMCQYVLRAGLGWHAGCPLGNLWTQKFGGMTYWDTSYAAEGMLRAGHIDMVRSFCDWLVRTALQPEGVRPHVWMTHFDGTPGSEPSVDKAYINCLAYAGIGIRLYEMTHSREDLEQRVFPYMRHLCKFLTREVLAQGTDGSWYLTGVVTGDITLEGEEGEAAKDQTDTVTWVAMIHAKYVAYADLLGYRDASVEIARAATAWYEQHPIRLNRRDMWYAWLPYLAPAPHLADFSDWWDNTNDTFKNFLSNPGATLFPEMYGERYNGRVLDKPMIGTYASMPWSNCSSAASFAIVGMPDMALEFQDGALKFVSGLGYFGEGPWELQQGGNSPYVPSSGSYLSCMQILFAHSSLWDDEIRIGETFPTFWRTGRVSWKNIRTPNGAKVSGRYDPYEICVDIESARPHRVRLRIPYRMAGEPFRLTLDGVGLVPVVEGEIAMFEVPAGRHTARIVRDLAMRHDVLVLEPFNQGGGLKAMAEGTGLRVRWLRDLDALPSVLDQVKVILLHVGYPWLSCESVALLRAAVEKGACLVLMYMGGTSAQPQALAEMAGVQAEIEPPFWQFAPRVHAYRLTDAGRARLPGVPSSFAVPLVHSFRPHIDGDTEVLAMDADDGVPALTCRSWGEGTVYWSAPGGKMMGRNEALGWGLGYVREIFVYGTTREDYADLQWLRSPAWQCMMQAVLKDAYREATR